VQEAVDESFAVAEVTALDEVAALLPHPSLGWGELEGPQSVGDGAEVLPGGVHLVNDILDADNIVVVELVLDLLVVADLDALAVDLEVTSLVHHCADSLQRWVSVGYVWLNHAEHVLHGLVELHKDSVEDLAETEQLEDLLLLWGDFGNTTDAGNDGNLGLRLAVEVPVCLRLAAEGNKFPLCRAVLTGVLQAPDVCLLLQRFFVRLRGGDGLLEVLGLLDLESRSLDC